MDKDPFADIKAGDDPFADITPERTTFAETGGGAALGRPRQKVSKVKEVTPLEAFGVGAVSRPVSTAVGAAQLATGGKVGTETAKKQAAELGQYKKQYPVATGAGEVAGDIGEFFALGGAGEGLGLLKGSEAALKKRIAEKLGVDVARVKGVSVPLKRRLAEQATIGGLQAGVKATPETEGMYKKAGGRAALGMATGAFGEAGATFLGNQLEKLGDLSESRRMLVNIADKFGLKLTPGEMTGNPMLKGADRLFTYMPFTAGQVKKINEVNEDRVAEVVLKAMGYNGKEINEQILGLAKEGIKQRYDDVLKDTVVTFDKQLQTDLLNIASENFITTTFQNVPKAQKLIGLLKGVEGKLSGEEYNQIRSIIGQYAAESSDDAVASLLYSLQRAVDKAAERTVKPVGFTEEYTTFMSERMRKLAAEEGREKTKAIVDNLKALRKQYTVYQDIYDAARHKGLTPDGGLSIAKLYDAVNRRRPGVFQAQKPGREMLPTEELALLQKIKGEPTQASTLAKTIPYVIGVGGMGTGLLSAPTAIGGLAGLRGAQAALYSEPVKRALVEGVSPTTQKVTPELTRALGLSMGLPFANKVGGQ
jgi:hypothetical protein